MADIYSRTGDEGETSLVGGKRVPKSEARVDLYGGVDELNSFLGLAASRLEGDSSWSDLRKELVNIQNSLLDLGSLLADESRCRDLSEDARVFDVAALEKLIDGHEENLRPLREFILPGGCEPAAVLHVCRTVCRRVERGAVAFRKSGQAVPAEATIWLNRLSDYLFVAARRANAVVGRPDITWRPNSSTEEPEE